MNLSLSLAVRLFEDAQNSLHATEEISCDVPISAKPFSYKGETTRREWQIELLPSESSLSATPRELTARFTLIEGQAVAVAGIATVLVNDWSKPSYLVLPGAVYNGNRFQSVPFSYHPRLPAEMTSLTPPTIITDVSRLNINEGESKIEVRAGDLAAPTAAFYVPTTNRGGTLQFAPYLKTTGEVGVLDSHNALLLETGLTVEENAERTQLTLQISAPATRSRRCVTFKGPDGTKNDASPDLPLLLSTGQSLDLTFALDDFDCESIPALFEHVFENRHVLLAPVDLPSELPFSEAWALQEEKYNRDAWREALDLYAVDPSATATNPYQTGWCGGLIATYTLLAHGQKQTQERTLRHLQEALTNGVAPSGFLWGKCSHKGEWRADCWYDEQYPHRKAYTLIRRDADVLFYGMKQLALLENSSDISAEQFKSHETALRGLAEAFVRLWRESKQFGQYIDNTKGELRLGNSSSAAIAPAGLCAAWNRWHDEQFLEVAQQSAQHYWENFTNQGFTTGGPGDALQCPDSESSYGLVESYVALYEATGEKKWLDYAEAATQQFASWVMPYDYAFPATSEYGRLDMKTNGTVWANAQNKHSAPGICTHSGQGILRIYRHTGDVRYLHLLRDIARALPQYLSREDRPIHDWTQEKIALPSGWMNERVNTSDWEGQNRVGCLFYGSTWAEVAMLLTWAELPGIYANTENRTLVAFDNVQANWTQDGEIKIENATKFPATVKLYIESGTSPQSALPFSFGPTLPTVTVPAESSLVVNPAQIS